MSASELLPASLLHRKAIVYVRQSTPAQENIESQRRQYDLVEVARQHGKSVCCQRTDKQVPSRLRIRTQGAPPRQ